MLLAVGRITRIIAYCAVIKEDEEEEGGKKTGIYHLECEKPTSARGTLLCARLLH